MSEQWKDKPEEYWKERLTPEQYRVMRQKGTEAPGTGKYVNHDEQGMYTCAGCGAELFSSDAKFESSSPGLTGWPAFSDMKDAKAIELENDDSMGMHRVEMKCARCGAHLGHLFENVPGDPSDKHYCANSCALNFSPHEAQ